MGGDSCSEGRGFKSHCCILDGHFSHLYLVKIVMFVWKDKNKLKRGLRWPIFLKKHCYFLALCNAFKGRLSTNPSVAFLSNWFRTVGKGTSNKCWHRLSSSNGVSQNNKKYGIKNILTIWGVAASIQCDQTARLFFKI